MNINNYHNSMFTGEVIHADWIDECARYLQSVFGETIAGKSIVDYGFGRGNWTLAFLKLGAESVTAVEASQSAADKFQRYIEANNIENVKIVVGNADNEKLNLNAEIVFLYGIFHHVEKPENLLASAKSWLNGDKGKVLVYAYDRGAMREILVNACREMLAGAKMEDGWELLLHPHARHRAIDDLTAPTITFWSADDLVSAASAVGMGLSSQAKDFSHFQNKTLAPEFDPYVLVLGPNEDVSNNEVPIANLHKYVDEYLILEEALDLIAKLGDEATKKQCAIGVFNSWFSGAEPACFEDKLLYLWRFLFRALTSNSSMFQDSVLSENLEVLVQLTRRVPQEGTVKLEGNCRMLKEKIANSSFRI